MVQSSNVQKGVAENLNDSDLLSAEKSRGLFLEAPGNYRAR